MYRTAVRSASRPALRSLRAHQSAGRRFASSASPADKPRSWKSSALRWGLAAGALYYYNTSSVFADEAAPRTISAPPSFAESDLPTVDSVLEEKRKQIRDTSRQHEPAPFSQEQKPEAKESESKPQAPQTQASEEAAAPAQGAEALEEEAGQQGAFNPETGEINWDCPCLGGMAHGPCGEEFKTAFSCFVYSEEDPKGMDCIEKFQGMQECFRQYPEIYGAELADEEDGAAQEAPEAPAAHISSEPAIGDSQQLREHPPSVSIKDNQNKLETDNLPGAAPVNDAVPTKWEDATAANEEEDKKDAKGKSESKE